MVFGLGWRRRQCGRILDLFENELGQVADQTAPLLRRELLIDGWSGMRFCTPQLQLRTLHDGSPGLAGFGLCSDRLRCGAANNQHAGVAARSLMQKRRSSMAPPNSGA